MRFDFEITSQTELADGSKELLLSIKAEQQVYLGYMLEALEGYCYHTITEIMGEKRLKITVVPDLYEDLISFLELHKELEYAE
jgi:hypothetical protein